MHCYTVYSISGQRIGRVRAHTHKEFFVWLKLERARRHIEHLLAFDEHYAFFYADRDERVAGYLDAMGRKLEGNSYAQLTLLRDDLRKRIED